MKKRDTRTAAGWRIDYYRLDSKLAAFAVAKMLEYDKGSVRVVSDNLIHQHEDEIEEIDPIWLLACSPLLQKPAHVIGIGVACGMLIFVFILAAVILILGGDISIG